MNLSDQTGQRVSSSGPPRLPMRRPGQHAAAGPAGQSQPDTAKAALEALDAELDKGDYATTLDAGDGQSARLAVANRHVGLSEDIYCDGRSYRWSWGQPIAAVGNPQAAAAKISYVLGSGPAFLADQPPATIRQPQPGDPTMADVQAQFPDWQINQGISDLFYAHHPATDTQVTGEDPLDLRDQIKMALARAYGPFIP